MENVEISAVACLGFPLSNPDVATVSAIIPRSVAIIPHKIADGVRSGLSALTCFPMP